MSLFCMHIPLGLNKERTIIFEKKKILYLPLDIFKHKQPYIHLYVQITGKKEAVNEFD